jgi:two-component system CheB/CheR fusion protein
MSDRDMAEGESLPEERAAPALPPSIADAVDGTASLLPFPTVAIGASAGGVDALQRLFHAMPPKPGCAFMVVMHLDPARPSMLASLLSRATSMPVVQAEHGTAVAADHVYIVPPGKYLEVRQGTLQVSPIRQRPPRPKAVDQLMVSLAQDQRERAVGIVLTGTDGDGTLGIKAIKGEGGLTIAQLPETAAHAGMPASAIATGMVDAQLRLEEIPGALISYIEHGPLASPPRATKRPPTRCATCSPKCATRAASTSAATRRRCCCAACSGAWG